MPYTSGAEGEDDGRSPPPSLARVRRLAIDGRLVGSFDWSFYQRRFDGAQCSVAAGLAAMPAAASSS